MITGDPRWQLAEINVALMRYPLEDPRMAGFRDASPTINLLAEQSPGFLSRRQVFGGEVSGIPSTAETPLLINISCWVDYESLHAFTYPGAHLRTHGITREAFTVMRRFEPG